MPAKTDYGFPWLFPFSFTIWQFPDFSRFSRSVVGIYHAQHIIQCQHKRQGLMSTSSCESSGAPRGTHDTVTRYVRSSLDVDSCDTCRHAPQIDATLNASMRQDARRLTVTTVLSRVQSVGNTTTHIWRRVHNTTAHTHTAMCMYSGMSSWQTTSNYATHPFYYKNYKAKQLTVTPTHYTTMDDWISNDSQIETDPDIWLQEVV